MDPQDRESPAAPSCSPTSGRGGGGIYVDAFFHEKGKGNGVIEVHERRGEGSGPLYYIILFSEEKREEGKVR